MQTQITIKMQGWLTDLRDSEKGTYAKFDYVGGSVELLTPVGFFKPSDINHCFEFEVKGNQANLPLTSRDGRGYNVCVFRPDSSKGFVNIQMVS